MILHKRLRRRRRAAVVTDLAPKITGRVGIHTRPADAWHEQPAHTERQIAHQFGGQTETRAAGEQSVLRVTLQLRRSRNGILPVSSTGDDLRDELLHVPAVLHEIDREPIEQIGMTRPLALRAEIGRRRDEAGATK